MWPFSDEEVVTDQLLCPAERAGDNPDAATAVWLTMAPSNPAFAMRPIDEVRLEIRSVCMLISSGALPMIDD